MQSNNQLHDQAAPADILVIVGKPVKVTDRISFAFLFKSNAPQELTKPFMKDAAYGYIGQDPTTEAYWTVQVFRAGKGPVACGEIEKEYFAEIIQTLPQTFLLVDDKDSEVIINKLREAGKLVTVFHAKKELVTG